MKTAARTFESVALAASGFGPLDYVRSLATSVLLIAFLNGLLVLFVVPATVDAGYRVKAEALAAHDANLWAPGRFISLRGGALLLFAETAGADGATLDGVFARLQQRGRSAWLSAARATLETGADGQQSLRFEQGHRYQGSPGQMDFEELDFARYTIDLQAGAADAPFRWDAVATARLRRSAAPEAQAEWQSRLARPLSALVLAVCAVWLVRDAPGGGRLGLLSLGLVIFAVYFMLLGVAHDFMARGTLAPWPGLWWVHAVPVLLSAAVTGVRRIGWRA